jgi:c-di-GMP-binding flagellar brake protein YcgR
MTVPALNRRKTQLATLAEACRRRQIARVTARAAGAKRSVAARFLALKPDALILQWPPQGPGPIAAQDATVDVAFQHGTRLLGFRTTTCGRVWQTHGGRRLPAWKLAVPLVIEPRERRCRLRIELGDEHAVHIRCTSIRDEQRRFTARLHDVSTGGLRIIAPRSAARWVQPTDMLWIAFSSGHEQPGVEFVVHVVHARGLATADTVMLGCRFSSQDDATEHDRRLDQLWDLLGRRSAVQPAGTAGVRAEE